MAVATASYQRCNAAPDFFEDFYRIFLTTCPEAEPRFANTDFERLHKLLRHAIGLLLIFSHHTHEEPSILSRVAERHSRRDLAIDPLLYPMFVDSLIAAVKAHDPAFTPETEEAWRAAIAPGVRYMQSKY